MSKFDAHKWFKAQYLMESPLELTLPEKIYGRLDSILMDLENVNENEVPFDAQALREQVTQTLAVLKQNRKQYISVHIYTKTYTMNDNFDLRKFLVESKSIENMNPIFRKLNENTENTTETTETTETTTPITENNLRAKIREMVLNELGGGENESEMMDEDELYEAKKDDENLPADDAELDPDMEMDAEMDAPEDELTAAASGATGDAKELINHLMTSLDTAKAMGNEKLTTQILNTLKFAIDQSMAQ